MTLVLPEIEKANCKSFTASAQVLTKAKAVRKLFQSDERRFVAAVTRGKSRQFVRLLLEESGHLHLDIVTPAYFHEGRKPKPTHAWKEIQALLGRFTGQEIQVRTDAAFFLPFQRLPQFGFIKKLSMKSRSSKVSMKLTGGTFSVTGAPIQRIAWSLERDEKEIEVRLRSTVKVKLTETYLEELFRLVSQSFQALVLNEEQNSDAT